MTSSRYSFLAVNSLNISHHRSLDFGLDNLMCRIKRELNEPKLLQRCQTPERIVSTKDGADMVFDLRLSLAIIRAEHRERLGAKNMMRSWHYNRLHRYALVEVFG